MLTELIVEDLGVIERAEVDLERGSIALTGETGAGKTLVVAAVGLLLGDRADRTLVRAGSKRARVEGRIVVPRTHPIVELLVEQELVPEAGSPVDEGVEICVTRVIDAGGGSRARINGHLVTLGTASTICGSLLAIAGQHAHHRISDPIEQRELFDVLAGQEAVKVAAEVTRAVQELRELESRMANESQGAAERERRIEVVRSEIEHVEALGLQDGEASRLRADAARLENAEELAAGIGAAVDSLRAEDGVEERLSSAERAIDGLVRYDPELKAAVDRLSSLRIEAVDVAEELNRRLPEFDAGSLEALRARRDEIARVARRIGVSEEELSAHLDSARRELAALEDPSGSVERLRELVSAAQKTADKLARDLRELRAAAAPRVAEKVRSWLERLALPDAVFEIAFEDRDLYEGGTESVAFMLSPNPGEPPKPLVKIASGGELARVALALLLATGKGTQDATVTMIFDEVDAGIGGGAARSVGRCLAELARSSGLQVLVVTHLPQIAAQADHHLVVSKRSDGVVTRSDVRPVVAEERVEELSRMLAGMPESDRARDHAKELLEEAGAR